MKEIFCWGEYALIFFFFFFFFLGGGAGGHVSVFQYILGEFRADFNIFFWSGGGGRGHMPPVPPWIRPWYIYILLDQLNDIHCWS